MSNSIQTRTEMALLAVSVENLHGFCDSAWVNRESRQLWWSLRHFRDNGMLEIGSGQHGKFIGISEAGPELEKWVWFAAGDLSSGHQRVLHCFIAHRLVSYQQ